MSRDGTDIETEAIAQMTKSALATALAVEIAQQEVRHICGEVYADTAEEIYEVALKSAGINIEGIPPESFRAMVRMIGRDGKMRTGGIATDSASVQQFNTRFPNAARIRNV